MEKLNTCPRCGATLQPNQQYCHRCGTQSVQTPNNSNPSFNDRNAWAPGQPSPQWYNNDPFAEGPEGKSRGLTALLAILFGSLGIQYFYLGKVGGGLLTILLSLITCGIWSLLVLIQGILMFTMDNNTFRNKYVLSNSFMPLF